MPVESPPGAVAAEPSLAPGPAPAAVLADGPAVVAALAALGREPVLRDRLVALLREAEATLAAPGRDVRSAVTGPLADALHADAGPLRLTLADGLVFDFHYASRIARAIVLRDVDRPDHVWEPQTTRALVHLAGRGGDVVIGGAYAGDQALLVARRLAAGGGVCHAFEPCRAQADRLRANAVANGIDNLHVSDAGLGDVAGRRWCLVGHDADAHAEPAAEDGPHDFTTTTIDAYTGAAGVGALALVMLDVEGGEAAALAGARGWLARPAETAPDLVFEVHRHYVDWSQGLQRTAIVRDLRTLGYHCFAIRDFHANVAMGARPIELIEPEHTVVDGPPHGFNMLAVKDRARIQTPPFTLVRDVSPKLLWHKDPSLHHPGP